MKIEIIYNGTYAICKITELEGHPDVFVNFNNADEFSQIYALSAFDTIKQHWERERKLKKK